MRSPLLTDIAGTVVRKALKTLRVRGLWGTMQYGGGKLLARMGKRRAGEADEEGLDFDRQFGVDTQQTSDPGWLGRLTSQNWVHGQAYQPAPIAAVKQALEQLSSEFAGATFVDIGSGKGRIVLLASLYPFARIIGIEYDHVLHEIATQNVASLAPAAQDRIELRCLDATEADFPYDPLVVFFHHPFERPIFEVVVRRLRESHEQRGQRICVIYFDPQCGDVFTASGAFVVQYRSSGDAVPYAVYRTRPAN